MNLEEIAELIEDIGNIYLLIVVSLMTIIIVRKILLEKRETKEWNTVRVFMFIIFFFYALTELAVLIYETTPIGGSSYGKYIQSPPPFSYFTLYLIFLGLMISFGLYLVAYANRWESFYYTPFFIFGSIFIFYLLTGFSAWLTLYIYITAFISILSFYITGFKLKDNGALGLAIFFTLSFIGLIIALMIWIIGEIFFIIGGIFGLFFSLGKFQPFKDETFKNE